MRVISLASGNSGNSFLIEAGPQGRTRLLVDAGIGIRILTQRLHSVGVHPSQLQGILITHEHSDHVQAIPALVKRYAIPVYADPRTLRAIEEGIRIGAWRSDSGRLIIAKSEDETTPPIQTRLALTVEFEREAGLPAQAQETLSVTHNVTVATTQSEPATLALSTMPFPAGTHKTIGDIDVTSFPISHDAIAPCGYFLQAGGCRVCIITDSGQITATMHPFMKQADLLILESNHDRERLVRGPYPWMLKNRILSSTGHLANDQAAEAVLHTWPGDGIRWLWLTHLSRTNNTPTLALESMRVSLQAAGADLRQVHISTLPPGMGPVWNTAHLWHDSSLWHMER